ncbi:MAG TPA: hypothetical protein VGF23_26575 [Gaiellaceae bacterium]|jgi:hypothetical protein
MFKKLSLLAALTAVAAALSAGLCTAAKAGPIINLDGCPTAAAQATLTLGQQPDSATGYPGPNLLCQRFVVDVNVAPTGGERFEIDASYAGPATGPNTNHAFGDLAGIPLSQSDCGLLRAYVSLYRKPWFTLSPPAKFSLVSSAKYVGVWHQADNDPDFPLPAHCSLSKENGSAIPADLYTGSTVLGGATYRVAVSFQTSSQRQVRVHAAYNPLPIIT